MLKKEHMVAGLRIITNDVIKDGLPSLGPGMPANEPKPYLSLFTDTKGVMDVGSGIELEIVRKPKKISGTNYCRVRIVGRTDIEFAEGEVYWCELRASCRMRP